MSGCGGRCEGLKVIPCLSSVVIALVLLTMAGLAFLLYRYLCHNRGAYRTTGEPAPGEDYEPVNPSDKKEYFI